MASFGLRNSSNNVVVRANIARCVIVRAKVASVVISDLSLLKADGIAFHFYGTDVNSFISWANKFHNVFGGGDVWVTEIACQVYLSSSRSSLDN